MSINSISNIAKVVNHINNPNVQTGTLLQEIPSDISRSYEGYKRGGILEGAEKLRKEVMSAVIWLFGIPAFNALGNLFCENVLKIPMNIDYSRGNVGRDSISRSVDFLTRGIIDQGYDYSDLQKYGNKFINADPNVLIKKIKGAKQITSIAALILNCALMGVVLPKINQAITRRKIQKQKEKNVPIKFDSMSEFQQKTKAKSNNINFGGMNIADTITYGVNNSNRFRLISTDVPMILGRVMTSRNKYEALEVGVIDFASGYFYNFCRQNVESILGKITKTPSCNPVVAEYLASLDLDKLKKAVSNIPKDNSPIDLKTLFNDDSIAKEIYKTSTYGKYGKANRFIKYSTIEDIDKSVVKFLRQLNKDGLIDNALDNSKILKAVKKINIKNAGFVGAGLITSIWGLGQLVPRLGYAITRKLTGRNEFSGIADYSKK